MKTRIETPNAPAAVGPYSQAISTGNLIFISGQLPINPESGAIEGCVKCQTKQSLLNIKAILNSQGLDMSNIVKTTVYLQHIEDFAKMNEVYASFFEKDPPARVAFEVVALPKGALVEIEAIACI